VVLDDLSTGRRENFATVRRTIAFYREARKQRRHRRGRATVQAA
jgi:hypothetical protein